MMGWLKKAPNSVIIAMIIMCGVIALGVLASYVSLTLSGSDTTDFRRWISTIGQVLVYPLLGINLTASVQAARSSSNAEDQTNGQLTDLRAENSKLRAQIEASRKATP